MLVNPKRLNKLNTLEYKSGPVIYFMNRDQRVDDNWAFLYAQELSLKHQAPLLVLHNLIPDYLGGGARQVAFKLNGLKEVANQLQKLNIPFHLITTDHKIDPVISFIKSNKAGYLVMDQCPLNLVKTWVANLRAALSIPMTIVDAHNIVPVWEASPKLEYAAYTIRPKINRQLGEYLEEFPKIVKHPHNQANLQTNIDWLKLEPKTKVPKPVTWLKPGPKSAGKLLQDFLDNRLTGYAENRNNPNLDSLSNLSPYLHYGHISAQRVALDTHKIMAPSADKQSFLEELIIRRELADNFCYYNANYDNPKGFHAWAQKTIAEHAADKREFIYTKSQFEKAKTHDELWNAAQLEMVKTGKMHGFMRMYWAKKILEWTANVATAQKIAIYLNDKYELDGRDPNGYAGIAWSIGGVHDRAWFEREVFGKIRYMNFNGCKRKFNVTNYINKVMAITS